MSSKPPPEIIPAVQLKAAARFFDRRIEFLTGKKNAIIAGTFRPRNPDDYMGRLNGDLSASHVALRLIAERRAQIQNEHQAREAEARTRRAVCPHKNIESYPPNDGARCTDCGAYIT